MWDIYEYEVARLAMGWSSNWNGDDLVAQCEDCYDPKPTVEFNPKAFIGTILLTFDYYFIRIIGRTVMVPLFILLYHSTKCLNLKSLVFKLDVFSVEKNLYLLTVESVFCEALLKKLILYIAIIT